MPSKVGEEYRAICVVPDEILISLAARREDRIERIRHRLDRADKDVLRQARIDRLPQSFDRDLTLIGVEMSNLSLGVHAGVGAGRYDEIDRMPHHRPNRARAHFLY